MFVLVLIALCENTGYQIALGAVKQGTLILPVRDKEKGETCANKLKKESKNENADIRLFVMDMSSKTSILAFAKWAHDNFEYVDVLINNAATVPQTRETTKDGLETQFGVNVFAYYILMTQLRDLLAKSRVGARVVNVASNYAGGVLFVVCVLLSRFALLLICCFVLWLSVRFLVFLLFDCVFVFCCC